jgi:hypothetical protein
VSGVLAVGFFVAGGCSRRVDGATEALAACALCHAVPPPEVLPRALWPDMVARMSEINVEYAYGLPLSKSQLEAVTEYYVDHAPTTVAVAQDPEYVKATLLFRQSPFGLAADPSSPATVPRVGHLELIDLNRDGWSEVLVSDIARNALTLIQRVGPERWTEVVVARIPSPARAEAIDADGDGDLDVIVASLGGIEPTDELLGRVVLLENDGRAFEARVLLERVPRVSDVRAADMDGDGDLDIVVAMFGFARVGEAAWLERLPDGKYTKHTIFARNGISHVPTTDLDRDGRPDVVLLDSQEHEEVLALLNRWPDGFETKLLYKAPHPMFGLSGIELVDLDLDGDVDVVIANGDALDLDVRAKPWHGVRWLENRGGLEFAAHDLVRFPGAYSTTTADLDGDGDLDVIVTSMMNEWNDPARQSLIWLENDGQQGFRPQALAASPTFLVTCTVGDLDQDGRQDILAGGLNLIPPYDRAGRVILWAGAGRP